MVPDAARSLPGQAELAGSAGREECERDVSCWLTVTEDVERRDEETSVTDSVSAAIGMDRLLG